MEAVIVKNIEFYIEKFSLAKYLHKDEREQMEIKSYEPQSFILMSGNTEKKLYFMVEGVAKVTVLSNEGKEMILDLVKPFDILGDLEFILGVEKLHNVEVVEKVITLEIKTENIKENSLLYKLMAETLAKKLQKNAQRIWTRELMDSKEIVLKFIKENKSYVEGYIRYNEMAKLLGISDRQLRRILVELSHEGKIIKKNKKIYIENEAL